jgi:multidrug efflux pump subunit AcrA (membrane-fusion protein)
MKKRPLIVLGGILIAASGVAAFVALSVRTQAASAASDPRQESPIVRLVTATRVAGSERGFTGIIGARVQSNLGFRVAGKIVERLVNAGQQVKADQPLMRIDETDLRLAVTAKRNAVAAVRASAQTRTYEARYVLDGEAASAPLGATVTIRLMSQASQPEVQVPLGAVLDDGRKTGVWVVDSATSTVRFRPVKIVRVSSESAVISGLSSGDPIVSLGAHLLQEGARVRTASESKGN